MQSLFSWNKVYFVLQRITLDLLWFSKWQVSGACLPRVRRFLCIVVFRVSLHYLRVKSLSLNLGKSLLKILFSLVHCRTLKRSLSYQNIKFTFRHAALSYHTLEYCSFWGEGLKATQLIWQRELQRNVMDAIMTCRKIFSIAFFITGKYFIDT